MADDVPMCYVNGKRHLLPLGRGEATLLQWLRGTNPYTTTLLLGAVCVLVAVNYISTLIN